ncbi:MAG: CotH kinase family protein [Lachnospiraceae bacterium]
MSTHKHVDKICCTALAFVLILTGLFVNAEKLGVQAAETSVAYETKLFDSSSVHTIDIVIDDWDSFLASCEDEEYAVCSVIIDNESYKNVGIRAKGNTSLSSVAAYGNNRYSFKIEFDHYDDTKTYNGLDKISLNNIIQDNTYMKDFLTYQMMGYFGVDAPLSSFVYITVNGEDWGLYLAVEGVEESFLERNYGSDYGDLYNPDSMSMGGAGGNGGNFDKTAMKEFTNSNENSNTESDTDTSMDGENMPQNMTPPGAGEMPNNGNTAENGDATQNGDAIQNGERSDNGTIPDKGGMGGGMTMGSDDVSLLYSDDDYDSYSNIFDNAKTNLTDADKDRLIASLKDLNEGVNIEEVVNVDEVIRYFVVHNFVCNFDSYTGSMIHNYYLYEEDGKLSMIPWDYNLAFGGFQSVSTATSLVNYPIDTPVSGGAVESRPMLSWIFENEAYTALYHQYFAQFISDYFDSGYFDEMIDSVTEMIAPYVEKDPTKFCTYEEFEEGASTLKEFCQLRAESINGQLDGTIPSTSDEQTQDDSALIDASSLFISAMGSMGNTMGKGDKMGNGEDNQGDKSNNSDAMPQMPGSNQQSNGNGDGTQTDQSSEDTNN